MSGNLVSVASAALAAMIKGSAANCASAFRRLMSVPPRLSPTGEHYGRR
ncbi:MAG: hypothetical protein WDN04_03595 [Rhodospirillales bacterium]